MTDDPGKILRDALERTRRGPDPRVAFLQGLAALLLAISAIGLAVVCIMGFSLAIEEAAPPIEKAGELAPPGPRAAQPD